MHTEKQSLPVSLLFWKKNLICFRYWSALNVVNIYFAALIVRFLTRKYLPEYTHGNITCYERAILLDEKEVSVRIIDTPGTVNSFYFIQYVSRILFVYKILQITILFILLKMKWWVSHPLSYTAVLLQNFYFSVNVHFERRAVIFYRKLTYMYKDLFFKKCTRYWKFGLLNQKNIFKYM